MANVSYKLKDLEKCTIKIGYVGENEDMHVLIDCKEVFKEYPNAVATMAIIPPAGEGYPKTVTRNGDVVEWLVSNSDVAEEGDGEFQITFTEGEVIKKSANGRFRVIRSISGNGEAPSGIQDWLTDANEKLAEVEAATQDAEAAASHTPTIGNDGYWYRWDNDQEEYVSTGTKAQGEQGDPGSPGDPTQLIDDTAGTGTTGKTWSADKLDEELTDVKNAINGFSTATAGDVGKALSPKTVADGKVTEWQFVEGGGGGSVALPLEPKDIMSAQIGRNLFNKYTISEGYNLNKDTGELVTNSYYFVSDFIEVEASTVYGVNLPNRFAWYKSDKTFISGGSDTSSLTSPANAKYLKVDYTLSMLDSLMVCKGIARTWNDKGFPYEVYFPWLKVPVKIDAFDLDKYGAVVVNMFNKATATDGQYVDHSDGVFRGSGTYFRSDYIPVKPNTEYTVSEPNRYAVYDSNYQYLTGANLGWNVHTFTTPNNAAYVVICGSPVSIKDDYIIAETANYPAGYESYGVVVPWIKPKVAKSKYDGKTLVCFGDSITYLGYTDTIEADTGMTVINQGYSSGRYAYADDANQYVNAFALHNLIDAIVTNDYTIPDTINGVTGYEEQAAQLAVLKQIDFTKVDFVSFALGTNDFSSETPLDNLSDPYDTDYFKGAIRYCIKTLLTEYPHIKIICATPFYRFWSTGGVVTDDCDTHQIGGKLLKDYCEAVEQACDDCHIPYVNNLNNAGVNEFNRLKYFNVADGLHPNVTGRAIIGHRIGAAILEQL